ncbi:ATPase [Deltaproteobacteria bacterium]|nr:ATPase [Deltaproteobacteria bacterium]
MHMIQQAERILGGRIPGSDRQRLVVITGPRQTGKTTLARQKWPELSYLNLDAIEIRESLRGTRTATWARVVGNAILDEAQKEPTVFDKVKYAYDAGDISFSVLLGSSRFLLLDRVRESLAGRAFVYELWPLCVSEVRSALGRPLSPPLLDALLARPIDEVLEAEPELLFGEADALSRLAIDHVATWGGYPELLRLDDNDRREWLRSYQQTWLESDLRDIGRVNDLLPFRRLQALAFLRSGQILSYSELARDAALPVATTRKYLEYLDLAFQVISLPPWTTNLTSAVIKTPKLYAADLGMLRAVTGQTPGGGAWFETLVVTEIHKWAKSTGRDVRLSFYRTRSGMEVDLLLETPTGVLTIEVKARAAATLSDARNSITVGAALGDRWRGALVVTQGERIERLHPEQPVWAVPISRLL